MKKKTTKKINKTTTTAIATNTNRKTKKASNKKIGENKLVIAFLVLGIAVMFSWFCISLSKLYAYGQYSKKTAIQPTIKKVVPNVAGRAIRLDKPKIDPKSKSTCVEGDYCESENINDDTYYDQYDDGYNYEEGEENPEDDLDME